MSAAVIVPYSSTPARDPLCWLVLDYYQDAHPEWPLTVARDHGRLFRKAQAVNHAVHELPSDVDVVVLNDADSLVPPEQVREAVRLAGAAPGLVFAYTFYHRLGELETGRVRSWEDALQATPERTIMGSGSHGCVAMRRDCFTAIGGLAEMFIGWGPEDLEFNKRAELYWPLRRVDGHLFHLWHGERREDDSPLSTPAEAVAENWRLYQETRA